MNLLKKFDWSFKSIAKIFAMVLLGILALSIVVSLVGFSLHTLFSRNDLYNPTSYYGGIAQKIAPMASYAPEAAMQDNSQGDSTVSEGNAGNFEIKEYSAQIKTRKLDDVCATLLALKQRSDVVFKTSNQNQDACNVRFKVKKEQEKEMVALITGLKPDSMNANITSLQPVLEQYDTELEILGKKLASIEETLQKAQNAYDELSLLATRKQDVETLTKIIDSKLTLIQKLTDERIAVKEQLDRSNKDKAQQLDRLDYVYFNVDVYKDLLLDWKQIKDSWKYEAKMFVQNLNDVFQDLTIRLAHYLVRCVEVAIYAFISLILIRLAWGAGKRIWIWKR